MGIHPLPVFVRRSIAVMWPFYDSKLLYDSIIDVQQLLKARRANIDTKCNQTNKPIVNCFDSCDERNHEVVDILIIDL